MKYTVVKIKERERVNTYNPFTSNYGGHKAKDVHKKINSHKELESAKKYIKDNKGYYDDFIIVQDFS